MDQRGGRRDKENTPASVYLIDHVGAVGGCQHGDVPELLHAVHLCQELGQDPVADAAGARRAGRGGREDKTDEWKRRKERETDEEMEVWENGRMGQ